MKTKLLTSFLATAATLTGLLAAVSPASAFQWNSTWTQPTIRSKVQTGFDDTPFQQFVQQERLALTNSSIKLRQIDPSRLRLRYDHDISVFFINEGARKRDQLAFQATKGNTTQSGLVFSEISSKESIVSEGGGVLRKGDGVSLGRMTAGTQLDFWLRAGGVSGAKRIRGVLSPQIYGLRQADNPDKLEHAVAYTYGRYLIIGFENQYGEKGARGGLNEESDRDFNDVVFVVDVGENNIAIPEPSMVIGLLSMGAVSLMGLRRRNTETSETEAG